MIASHSRLLASLPRILLLATLLAGCTKSGSTSDSAALGAAVPAGRPLANPIPCESAETLLFHIHAHLAVYQDGAAVQVPHGIGIGQPWNVQNTSDGPFVAGGSCFSWLHTHANDGIIHIEAPQPQIFTLGDFFGVWGQPLGPAQVGPIQGPIAAYVDGERFTGDPTTIPLSAHAVIQLNVGNDYPPPKSYTFANGQ